MKGVSEVFINNIPDVKRTREVRERLRRIEALEPMAEFDFSKADNAIILWAEDEDEAKRVRQLWRSTANSSRFFIQAKIFRDEAGEIGIAIWRTT